MTTAANIAQAIEQLAEACMQRQISLQVQTVANEALWAWARILGCEAEVERLVQKVSDEEFDEACKAAEHGKQR
jgi:hypothetical protein